MNAIRESVRHEIDVTFQAEERARLREEEGLDQDPKEEEGARDDPVPAITRAHFEVRYTLFQYSEIMSFYTSVVLAGPWSASGRLGY